MDKHIRVNYTIPASVDAIIRKIAEDTGLKLSTIISKAVTEYVKKHYEGKSGE
jgi:hypothetical protein